MKIPPPKVADVQAAFAEFAKVTYIASGGWKDVYSFELNGTRYALLLVPLYSEHEIADPDDFQRISSEIKSRVRREVRILAEADCSGLVKLGPHTSREEGFSTVEISGRAYLWFTEEFVEGESLKKQIVDSRLATPRDLIDLFEQVLPCLECFRLRKVVHRDIKPENIMRTSTAGGNKFTLLDAGIVLDEHGTRWTMVGSPMGTWRYMSPEQLRGDSLDWRSDLFSLAVAAFEYASGTHPFARGATTSLTTVVTSVLNEAPLGLAATRPDIPSRLTNLIGRMLSKKPHLRPGNIDLILGELRKVGTEVGK